MQVRVTYEHEATSRAPEGTYEVRQVEKNGQSVSVRIRPVGLVIDAKDQPDCWKLVCVGVAVPHDEECKARFTEAQVEFAQQNGHARFMRKHQEALIEAREKASEAEFIEPDDSED